MMYKQQKNRLERWKSELDILIKISSLLTIGALVLGYGYLSGKAELFGLRATDLIDNPMDIFSAALTALMTVTLKLLEADFYAIPFNRQLWINSIVFGVISLFCFGLWAFSSDDRPSQKPDKATRTKRFFKACWHVISGAQFSDVKKRQNKLELLGWSLCCFIVGLCFVPILIIIDYFIMLLMAAMFLIIPTISALVGMSDAQHNIIDPTDCASYINLNTTHQKTNSNKENKYKAKAICLSVLKDGNEIARGRLIHRSSDTLFLYSHYKTVNSLDNTQYRPISLPIKDVTIESVKTD